MARNGGVPGSSEGQDGDPFADFGLEDEDREFFQADVPKAKEPQVKGKPRAAKMPRPEKPAKSVARQRTDAPPVAQFKWQPADFEMSPGPYLRDCRTCFHYVRGGNLAVEKVHELKSSRGGTLHRVIADCKKYEREFEFHELEQMIEKSRILDTQFDEVPRIRNYCFAGSTPRNLLAHIPEIKNYDGKCRDYLPGHLPVVFCDTCIHVDKPYKQRPYSSTSIGDTSQYRDLLRGSNSELANSVIGGMRRERQRREEESNLEEEDYAAKLSDDVMTMIYDNRSPENGTLDRCKANSYRACAAENRTLHCPQYSASEPLEEIAGEARWRELTISDKKFRETAETWINIDNEGRSRNCEEAKKSLAQRPPCFSCVHQRAPVNNDLFGEVHYNGPDIMNRRDGYRREKKLREAEERRVGTQPSNSLGSDFPPQRQAWCDKYSIRSQGGKVQEYAYCLCVLKRCGGNCPSYEKIRENSKATLALPSLPVPPVASKPTAPPSLNLDVGKSLPEAQPFAMDNPISGAWLKARLGMDKPFPGKWLYAAVDSNPTAPLLRDWLSKQGLLAPIDSKLTPTLSNESDLVRKVMDLARVALGASERKCGRCKGLVLVIPAALKIKSGKDEGDWCATCKDWAAPE